MILSIRKLCRAVFLLLASLLLVTSVFGQDSQVPSVIIIDDEGKDVPYVPTPNAVVEAMLDIGDVGPGEYVIDLGSGDGRIVIAAAKRGAIGHGIDIDRQLVDISRENARKAGVANRVMFLQQDIFESDISDASVITMFLLPDVNNKLRPVFMDTLKPGTRIVSHSFSMAQWQPDSTYFLKDTDGDTHTLYYWVVPADVQGDWTWNIAGKTYHAKVQQDFQRISMDVSHNGSQPTVGKPVLRGERINFTITNNDTTMVYSGRVAGHSVSGFVQIHAKKTTLHTWRATRQ